MVKWFLNYYIVFNVCKLVNLLTEIIIFLYCALGFTKVNSQKVQRKPSFVLLQTIPRFISLLFYFIAYNETHVFLIR